MAVHPNPVIACEIAGHYIKTVDGKSDVCVSCGQLWKCDVMLNAEAAARVRNQLNPVRLLNDPERGGTY